MTVHMMLTAALVAAALAQASGRDDAINATARWLSTDGVGRVYDPNVDCKLWGWGRLTANEILQPYQGRTGVYAPVEITADQLGQQFDPAQIKSIQAGATGTAASFAVMCTCLRVIFVLALRMRVMISRRCARSTQPLEH